MGWFRVYEEVVEDPKVQRLAPGLFKTWVNLLCVASKHGGKLPPIADAAYALRLTEADLKTRLDILAASGLFEQENGNFVPHNWDGRQYKSDNSTERVKQWRERKRNVSTVLPETPPDTEQSRAETEAEADARELPPIALAQKVAAELCLTGRSWIDAISGAIEFCVKFDGKTANQAVEFLIAEAKASIKRGSAPSTFWFAERKWQKTGAANGSYQTIPKAGTCKRHPNIATTDGKCPMCNPESPEQALQRIRGKGNPAAG